MTHLEKLKEFLAFVDYEEEPFLPYNDNEIEIGKFQVRDDGVGHIDVYLGPGSGREHSCVRFIFQRDGKLLGHSTEVS